MQSGEAKGEQQLLNSISARKEDSEIYQRMGSAKYTVYSLIALVIVGLYNDAYG